MKEPKKSPAGYAALAFAVIVLLCLIALICLSSVEAGAKETEPTITSICKKVKEPDGEWWNHGHLYIVKKGVVQFGWVTYKGNTYYCHENESKKYPRGSATRGEMRIKGGKFYAFNSNCRMIIEDFYLRYGPIKKRLNLKINKDKSVRYIYNTARIHRNWRYSTAEHRLQICGSDNRWRSTGMQYWPDYIDWQR